MELSLLISPPESATIAVSRPRQVSINMAAQNLLDQNTIEIKTKSIEQTLLPLVKQVRKAMKSVFSCVSVFRRNRRVFIIIIFSCDRPSDAYTAVGTPVKACFVCGGVLD